MGNTKGIDRRELPAMDNSERPAQSVIDQGTSVCTGVLASKNWDTPPPIFSLEYWSESSIDGFFPPTKASAKPATVVIRLRDGEKVTVTIPFHGPWIFTTQDSPEVTSTVTSTVTSVEQRNLLVLGLQLWQSGMPRSAGFHYLQGKLQMELLTTTGE